MQTFRMRKPKRSRLLPRSPWVQWPRDHVVDCVLDVIEELGRLAIERMSFKNAPQRENSNHSDIFGPEIQTIGHRRHISFVYHGKSSFPERTSKLGLGSPAGKSTLYRESKARAR